jgi:hypothetical protein
MPAITLVEASKLALNEGKTLRASVIAMFAQASDILMAMPFKSIQGNAYQYNREGVLPSVAFRGVNESYTATTGIINQLVEALRICGGDLDVDAFILSTQGDGVRAAHENLKIKALAAELTRVFIKGDSTSDLREFDGLQNRITGSQLVEAGSTNGGDALSLTKLDELIDSVTNPTHLLMNKTMRRRLTAAARSTSVGGFITWDKDAFGRPIAMYNDLPILTAYSDNGGTDPIAFDEVGSGGATATATSVYCVGFGDGLVTGLQSGPMSVRDLGELETTPAMRTRVEWYAGMCIEHGRAAGRLRGISNAAVVA